MRLEQAQEERLAKRKGLTGRTIIQMIWLVLTGTAAYFLTTLVFARNGNLYEVLYSQFSIPRFISPTILFWAIVIAIVLLMQLVFVLGFLMASPEGWRRPGEPSLYSRNREPFDDRY
ncbi:MAG: hypothetical protein AAF614_35005 [Chloroflexota bacterium]